MQYRESNIASMPAVRLTCGAAIVAAVFTANACRSNPAPQQQAPGGMPPTPVVLAAAIASPVEDAT